MKERETIAHSMAFTSSVTLPKIYEQEELTAKYIKLVTATMLLDITPGNKYIHPIKVLF